MKKNKKTKNDKTKSSGGGSIPVREAFLARDLSNNELVVMKQVWSRAGQSLGDFRVKVIFDG